LVRNSFGTSPENAVFVFRQMSEANCDTAVSKTLLCGAASRDCERVRDDPSRGAVEREEAGREEDPRALEREELEREELEREELDRADPDEEARGVAERLVVECERVPRRVGSLELTVRPPLSSSIDQIHPVGIHLPLQHLHQLCPRWLQPLLQCQQEYSRL